MFFLVVPALLYGCWKAAQLLFADADLSLLSKGSVKAGTFQGKVVWITGASQGLGESLAIHLSGLGARLILSSRRKDALEAVRSKCKGGPDDVITLPFDLCGPYSDLEAAVKVAEEAFAGQGFDYLIHNAGASQHALAHETSCQVTRQLFDLNTLGPIQLTRAALPGMLSRGKGRIVVVSSMASKVPSPGQAVYSACKMALYGYFATLAAEVADRLIETVAAVSDSYPHRGVAVTICCPGPVDSGSEERPRVVFGPTGQIVRNATSAASKAKLSLQRCTELVVRAAAHGVDECWIAVHPVLIMGYISQYVPWLGMLILKKVGPKRARAVNDGQSGYDVKALMKQGLG